MKPSCPDQPPSTGWHPGGFSFTTIFSHLRTQDLVQHSYLDKLARPIIIIITRNKWHNCPGLLSFSTRVDSDPITSYESMFTIIRSQGARCGSTQTWVKKFTIIRSQGSSQRHTKICTKFVPQIWVNKLSDLRVRGVDPDGDRLTFGVTGRDSQLVRLEQQGDNQVNHHETKPPKVIFSRSI